MTLDAQVPPGPLAEKWTNHKFDTKLVAPQNRRKFEIICIRVNDVIAMDLD